MTKRALSLLLLALAAGCASERPPPPEPIQRPAPAPVQTPRPIPPPAPAPAPFGWADVPLTPGQWYYSGAQPQGSTAVFSTSRDPNVLPLFVISCDPARREVWLTRGGAAAGANMMIRTTSGARSLPIRALPGGDLFAVLAARDPFLDNMIFSRGRFSADLPGTATLVIPAWAEPARVVEDCRK